MQTKSSYIHGADPQEQARLEMQHRLLGGSAFLPAVKPGWRVLDVGAGTGAAAREVARKAAPGVVIGIDMQMDQIKIAKRFADRDGIRNVEFKLGSAQSLDLPDNSFDLVYCRFLLEHVSDPVAVVREMARMAKAGGSILACECDVGCCSDTEPSLPAAGRALEALYRLQKLKGGDPYVAQRLESIFLAAGLINVRADAITVKLDSPDQVVGYSLGGSKMVKASEPELLEKRLLSREELDEAYREWEHFPDSPGALALFKLRRVQGLKIQ